MSRYIDAEELKHIVNNSKYYGTERQRDFCDMITEAPAADVEPVRHGKVVTGRTNEWYGYTNKCSGCGGEWFGGACYCPYCGAKMDGGEE